MNAFDTVDEFLMAWHRLQLEDVLCDGCLVGRLGVALGDSAKILPRLVGSTVEEDGGVANVYDGILVLEDVWYRFRCQVFIDGGGQRFLSNVSAFDAVEWQARVALSA
ncbi:MAG TPA: hypothetical protein VJO12_13530 [Stellaceae bacterium]|nr:hypothetical protein [Stellaceae bacterium]